ncbi:MAG: hypothetical protein AAGH76_09065 [Pseudomonadota bacterium]
MSENAAGLTLTAGLQLHERYVAVRSLHETPRSSVWLCTDERTRAAVVLKRSDNPAALQREWETLRAINHPHVVRAFDFHDGPPAAFAQYHIDGQRLVDLGAVDLVELARPIRLVVRALAYLHGRDVSHGDFSPSNILFDRGGAPFLIDFGSASRGSVIVGGGDGTPAYRSPERRPGEPATPSDDIFALGSVLKAYVATSTPTELTDLIATMCGPVAERPNAEEIDKALELAGISATALPASLLREPLAPASADIEPAIEPTVSVGSTAKATIPIGAAPAAAPPPVRRGGGLSVKSVVAGLVVLLVGFAALLTWVGRGTGDVVQPAMPTTTIETPGDESKDTPRDAADSLSTGRVANEFGEQLEFNEGSLDSVLDASGLTAKQKAGRILGELLAKQEVLEGRGVATWASVDYERALETYESGDQYYIADDFENAIAQYSRTVAIFDTLIDRVTGVFDDTLSAADAAFADGDSREAERLYGIALEITPNDPRSSDGLARAQRLDQVLALVEAAADAEFDGDYVAAKAAYQKALDVDPEWPDALTGLERTAQLVLDGQFRDRMTDGFLALDEGRLGAARRAFREARTLKPGSREPTDGLLQVDQAGRLTRINTLQSDAATAEREENWPAAIALYQEMLTVDDKLVLARDGLADAQARKALDDTLARYLGDPDLLTDPTTLKAASGVLTRMAAIEPQGPRLRQQRDDLQAALKRAATPIKVDLVSDELTDVSVYKVGRLGQFDRTTLVLRPGLYTAVGTRLGYRDVRLEFRVSPEDPPAPVVVRCEEQI